MNSWLRALMCSVVLFTLTACGGGGSLERDNDTGTGGGGNTGTVTYSISLSIADTNGNASNELSSSQALVVTATVTDSNGNQVGDALVSFSFSQTGLAVFNNDTGTALTNSSGVATIGLNVGDNSGDGLVIGAVEQADGSVVNGQVGFSSAGSEQTTVEPASLQFFASTIQLPSSGSDEIELIAVVKNEQNILLEGVSVSFSADNDAELQITQGTSAADGTARAVLTSTTNPQNRTIVATASTGGLTQTIEIDVVGTEVNINGPSSVIINDPAPLTIIVADSDGNGIPNQAVSISAQNGTISNVAPLTGPNGQVTVDYSATVSGTDVITASSLNASGTLTVTVQQDEFGFTTLPSEEVALGDAAEIVVTWLKEGTAFVGGEVTFTTSRGSIAVPTVVTDAQGQATISIQSADAGIASISAEGVDADNNVVSARARVEFIATVPSTIIVDGTPDSIGPDGQTSTITAVVRDPAGNLVKGQTVNFSVDDVTGGFVSPNSATTDSSGIASTVYTSNVVSSQDSVVITAEVAGNPAISDTTVITVGDRAFDISLGTGREIEAPDNSTYLKEFAAFVSDADANPVANAALSVSSTPVKFSQGGEYRKGYWQWDPVVEIYYPFVTAHCPNEDINANGILDAGEDTNGDGKLTPGNVAVSSNTVVTNENGQATIELRYPKQYATWVDVTMRVSGQSAGSEAVESQDYTLPVAAEDVNEEGSPPPVSPFGISSQCTDAN